MYLNFVAFNFRSADLETEERNYLGYHVELAKRFPNLRQYYTGRLMKAAGKEPERFRAAILAYDGKEAYEAAIRSEVVPALVADSQAHLKDMLSHAIDGAVIVPFPTRRVGQSCFVMAAAFDLEQSGGADAAEKHYLEIHTAIARRLPGLRNYMIGKMINSPGTADGRYRMAILVFDSLEAYRDAYRSPVGQELIKDEQATIRNPVVWRLDARVEL